MQSSKVFSKTGKNLRFDIYIEGTSILIEYDDASHFEEVSKFGNSLSQRKELDFIKDNWCKEHGFHLYRQAYYNRWDLSKVLYWLEKEASFLADKPKSNGTGYIGVTKKGKKFLARASDADGNRIELIRLDDPLRAALYREGYLITSGFLGQRNNFSLDILNSFGISEWKDYKKLDNNIEKSSQYIGVYCSKRHCRKTGSTYMTYTARITVCGKTKNIISSKDEKRAALYREGYLLTNNIKQKLNNFSDKDFQEYGLVSYFEFEKLKDARRKRK